MNTLDDRIKAFNKGILNPLMRKWAASAHGPFAIVQHVGRRSGKVYETPIIVMPMPGGFAIALTYGPDVDWYRNVVAAGHFTLLWHRQAYAIDKLEPMDEKTAMPLFPRLARFILRKRHKTEFIRLISQPALETDNA